MMDYVAGEYVVRNIVTGEYNGLCSRWVWWGCIRGKFDELLEFACVVFDVVTVD